MVRCSVSRRTGAVPGCRGGGLSSSEEDFGFLPSPDIPAPGVCRRDRERDRAEGPAWLPQGGLGANWRLASGTAELGFQGNSGSLQPLELGRGQLCWGLAKAKKTGLGKGAACRGICTWLSLGTLVESSVASVSPRAFIRTSASFEGKRPRVWRALSTTVAYAPLEVSAPLPALNSHRSGRRMGWGAEWHLTPSLPCRLL